MILDDNVARLHQNVTRHARDGSGHFKIYVWSIEEFAGLINSKPPTTVMLVARNVW